MNKYSGIVAARCSCYIPFGIKVDGGHSRQTMEDTHIMQSVNGMERNLPVLLIKQFLWLQMFFNVFITIIVFRLGRCCYAYANSAK